jgi:lysine-N-methylase
MLERLTLRYLPHFRCIAGDCRENCCAGLHVQLTEENHRKLLERSAAFPQLAAKVEQVVRLETEQTRTAKHYAHFEAEAEGSRCVFLDGDWLCGIHRHLGEETLADPCSTFPRVLNAVGDRLELSATFACPEAARLCLTGEDPVALVPWEPALLPREIVVRRHDAASADPYVQLLDDVRQVCLQVLRAPNLSPQVQLLCLADFARRIEPFFHAGTTTFELSALAREVEALPSRAAPMAALLAQRPAAGLEAVRAMKEIFLARLPGCDNARFAALVRPVVLKDLRATSAQIAGYFTDPSVGVDDAGLRDRYLERCARLSAAGADRVDAHLSRYAHNAIIKDWYTLRPTLASSLRRLVLRAALSRFATLFHPTLDRLAQPVTAEQERECLDEAAVDAFQIVSKNVEHVPSFMDLCEASLAERGLDSLTGLATLLRL